jgi:hypothetical protein
MEISNFKALTNHYSSGVINNTPVIYLQFSEKNPHPASRGEWAKKYNRWFRYCTSTNNVVYSVGKKAKNYQLLLKSFDEDGNQLGQISMNPTEQYAQMNAKSNRLLAISCRHTDIKKTIGSSKGPSSQGLLQLLFRWRITRFKIHSFTQFDNFLIF